jgi:sugar phosphate isomerase/epimerase
MERNRFSDWSDQYVMSTCVYRQESFELAVSKIAASGFKSIEVFGSSMHLDPRYSPDVKAARELLRKTDLQVHSIHTPFSDLKLGHPDQKLKQEWLRVIGASLEIGVQIGAPLAVVHVTGEAHELTDAMFEASKQIAMDFIEELRIRAQKLGIRLAIENLTRVPNLQRRFGMTLGELCSVFPGSDIGFCLDTGHTISARMDMAAEINAAADRLVSIHLDSNDGTSDKHWLPTCGILDWPLTKKLLKRGGYEGEYVLELVGYDDPDGVLAQAVDFAKSDWGKNE